MRILNSSHLVLLVTVSSLALAGCNNTNRNPGLPTVVNNAANGTVFVATRGSGFEAATITSNGANLTGMNISSALPSATFTSLGEGLGFTAGIPADASSNSSTDTADLSYLSFVYSPPAVFPSGTLQADITTAGSQTMVVDKFGASQSLQYSEYGLWLEPGAITATAPTTAAVFAFGTETTTMPTTGTATYTGGASGIAANTIAGTTTAGEFAGTASFTANFAANTITGSITNINFSSSTSGGAVSGTMNDVDMTGGTIAGSTFVGSGIAAGATAGTALNISGANSGRFGGQFNGPNAQEVAGTFQLSGGANSAKVIGSFGAHQ